MLILGVETCVNGSSFSNSEDNSASLSDTIKVGAFADSCRQQQNPLEPEPEIPSVPFSSLLTPRQQSPPQTTSVQPSEPPSETGGGTETEDDGNGNVTPRCDSRRSSCSMLSTNEDFIMVDLVIICYAVTCIQLTCLVFGICCTFLLLKVARLTCITRH
jgi:hypothetical protein